MTEALRAWADRVLGPSTVVGAPPTGARRTGTPQCVLEVEDGEGRRWFAKQAATADGWRAKVRAYRRWAGALGDHAPTLRAADRDLHTLLVSGVPGTRPDPLDPAAHTQAGVLLRRLHEAAPAGQQRPRGRRRATGRLRRLLSQPGLLTPDELAFVEDHVATIEALPLAATVPCHGDYAPHNWLVDDAGVLRVIDFGNARRAPAAHDFSRPFYGACWRRPDLARRFFDGYGRDPSDDELAYVQSRVVLHAVDNIRFGLRQGSTQHEERGRARLADLLAGHRVRHRETLVDRARRLRYAWLPVSGRTAAELPR